MSHSPISILSQTDFNGRPIPTERLNQTFHDMMAEYGYVMMVNVPKSFDPVNFCKALGPFVPNYNGAVVADIRPEPGMDDVYHAGNTKALTPHTEGYDFEIVPPRYIALWCMTPVSSGGETTIADTSPWIDDLQDEELSHFKNTIYDWKTTDGVLKLGLDLKTRHPIIEDLSGERIIRFSCNNLKRGEDDPAAELQEQWKRRFDEEHVAIQYGEGDMLVWDNWRMLHARNAFIDRGRHLRRIQIGYEQP